MGRAAVALLVILGLWTSDAHAQRREHERERFHSDHWVYDDRFHCESAKAYYPYVGECKEGWRPVPATPPGPR